MRCPYCHRDNDRVLDTRASEDGFAIRRRRICNGCQRRFTTYERLEELALQVVKKINIANHLAGKKFGLELRKRVGSVP